MLDPNDTPFPNSPHTSMAGAWALPRGDICQGEAVENSYLGLGFLFCRRQGREQKVYQSKLRQRTAEATRRRSVKNGQMEGRETLTGTCHPCSPAFPLPLLSVTRHTRSLSGGVTRLLRLGLCDHSAPRWGSCVGWKLLINSSLVL